MASRDATAFEASANGPWYQPCVPKAVLRARFARGRGEPEEDRRYQLGAGSRALLGEEVTLRSGLYGPFTKMKLMKC